MCSSIYTSESTGPDNWMAQKKISTIFWDVPTISAVVIQMTAKLITLLAGCSSKTIIPTEILFFIERKGKNNQTHSGLTCTVLERIMFHATQSFFLISR